MIIKQKNCDLKNIYFYLTITYLFIYLKRLCFGRNPNPILAKITIVYKQNY